MPGEQDINVLLRSLAPALDDRPYVFATGTDVDAAEVANPLGVFREGEGTTIICSPDEAARLGLRHSGLFRRITLTVHSSLDAVGLTARVSGALAAVGIPCNVVAGYFHDHLFVPADRAEDAMAALRQLA
jgi:hypothetical protein